MHIDDLLIGHASEWSFITDTERLDFIAQFPLPDFLQQASPVAGLAQIPLHESLSLIVGVQNVERRAGSDGRPFLTFTVFDPTETLRGCKVWFSDEIDLVQQTLETEPVVEIHGVMSEYNGKRQVVAHRVQGCPSIRSGALLPNVWTRSDTDLNQCRDILISAVSLLIPAYKTVVETFLLSHWDRFCRAPAALMHHQAYIGGLLQHTSEVVRLVDFIIQDDRVLDNVYTLLTRVQKAQQDHIFEVISQEEGKSHLGNLSLDHVQEVVLAIKNTMTEPIDRDLCITAAILHDAGKMLEYQYDTKIDWDERGKMLGHMMIVLLSLRGTQQLREAGIDLEPLYHAVLAHHGKLEWGSPVVPQTAEAWIVHLADYVGSRLESRKLE